MKPISFLAGLMVALGFATAAHADAEAEKYVDDALPLMYHTCASVVDESDGNNAYVDKVIRALLAVSLYNREVDISAYAKTDAEKTALQEKFAAELGQRCRADNNALLAGVIDDAVAHVLSTK
ncbi:MAG: hypothetical protein AB7V13_02790 [Pseudorhodoplanes sp.]